MVSVVLIAVLLVALGLLSKEPIRRRAGVVLARVGHVLADLLGPVRADDDDDSDLLYQVMRRERLVAHLRRLEVLIVTDEEMSATRQIGNRIAYAWLLNEIDGLPPVFLRPDVTSVSHWGPQAGRTAPTRAAPTASARNPVPRPAGWDWTTAPAWSSVRTAEPAGVGAARGAKEFLDLGWGR